MRYAAQVWSTVLTVSLFTGSHGQLTAQTPGEKSNLSRSVAFKIGDTYFLDGDSITIDQIEGPAETIAPGNVYLVSGTYKLASHPDAVLSSNTTSKGPSGPTSNHDPLNEPRSVKIQKGEGHFSVYLHMETAGYPHISFYPTGGGGSFAGVYFGEGELLLKPRKRSGATPPGTDTVTK